MKASLVATAVVLCLSLVACGSATGRCQKSCENAAECGDPGDDYVERCEEACAESEEFAKEADCWTEYKWMQRCYGTKVDCEDPDARREACEEQRRDFEECVSGNQ